MALDNDIAVLQRLEFFSDFDDAQLRMLAFGSQKMRFPKGTVLFHSGQTSDGAYVITSGEIRIEHSAAQNEIKTEKLGVGGMIGELSLIIRNQRTGTATVSEACEVLKIRRDIMHRILEEYPHLAVGLHKRIAASVANIGKQLEKLQQKLPTADA